MCGCPEPFGIRSTSSSSFFCCCPRSSSRSAKAAPQTASAGPFGALRWRSLGPARGGRSIAVAGSAARPYEYYMGATGGGLWKTTDAGISWKPVTDGLIHYSSVGAVAVSASNPDIVYIGTGEADIRGNIIQGGGAYKSSDAGKTWTHIGLADTQVIAKIRVHPTNPDLVYVAAFGHHAAPNPERGVFRSRDGGKTWEKILFRDNKTGADELVIDPNNPQVIYVALWEAYRNAFEMSSGGPGSGIFKSTDGGDHWTEISRNPGLPKTMLGKIGLSVSGADSNRVYAQIEAEDGGFFLSDDAGATWKKVNERRDLRQRAFYYSRVYADPKVKDTVWVLNVNIYKSTDAGKTWKASNVPHGDNHDMWIASNDSNRMIEANDGGGTISVNGGETWTPEPMPTAQFYHVITTKHVPYHICGAQQDNSTACVSSQPPQGGPGGSGGGADLVFYSVGGGESGYIASDPRNPDIFYAGSYGGLITRLDKRTGQERQVNPYPDNPMGYASADIAERFQWTFPIVIAPTDPRIIYVGSQHVWKSTNEGQSWERISPDLTRHDPKTMGPSGGPLTKDNTGVETYATVFAIAPSARDGNVIWAGSDDGYVQVTRNAGTSWKNVTPKGAGRLCAHQPHRGVAVPRGHRVRGGQPLSARRLQAVRVSHGRLRRNVDGDHQRRGAERFRARDPRGHQAAEAAVSRHGARDLHLVRRRRQSGSRCGRTCRTRRSTTSRSRSVTSSSRRTDGASTSWTISRRCGRAASRRRISISSNRRMRCADSIAASRSTTT